MAKASTPAAQRSTRPLWGAYLVLAVCLLIPALLSLAWLVGVLMVVTTLGWIAVRYRDGRVRAIATDQREA